MWTLIHMSFLPCGGCHVQLQVRWCCFSKQLFFCTSISSDVTLVSIHSLRYCPFTGTDTLFPSVIERTFSSGSEGHPLDKNGHDTKITKGQLSLPPLHSHNNPLTCKILVVFNKWELVNNCAVSEQKRRGKDSSMRSKGKYEYCKWSKEWLWDKKK